MLISAAASVRRGSVRLSVRSSVSSGMLDLPERAQNVHLGSEADAARPPFRRIIVTGTQSAGKSTLIRQLGILFSVQSGEQGRLKFKKEVHKVALQAFQSLLSDVYRSDPIDDVKAILDLRTRSPITTDLAESLARICAEANVQSALGGLEDVASRQACTYFIRRLRELGSPGFVPSLTDLLYLNVPTSGRQESRLQGTPGGPLSVVEMSIADFCQVHASLSV